MVKKNLYFIIVSVQNQDRVRKCGGLDTFVKLLKRLLTNLDTDPGCKTTTIHLLNTMDSCITDNGGFRNFFFLYIKFLFHLTYKVSKGTKIRNQCNQVPHLTQDTNGKVTNSQLDTRRAQRHNKHKTEKT